MMVGDDHSVSTDEEDYSEEDDENVELAPLVGGTTTNGSDRYVLFVAGAIAKHVYTCVYAYVCIYMCVYLGIYSMAHRNRRTLR